MSEKTRVIIADDHPMFRSGLRLAIETDATFEVVGEAGDGAGALRLVESESPDIVILDVNMPELDGFEVIRELRRRQLSPEIVMLTMHKDEGMFSKALALGARGYVIKDSAAGDIVQCLHAVRRGQNYTSAAVTTFLVKKAGSKPAEGIAALTPAERNVLRMIADYKTSRRIAEELGVSLKTIENHRTNISSKLGVHGSHALIKFALQNLSEI